MDWLGPLATAAAGLIGWGVRVESRVSTQEKETKNIKESVRGTIESIDKRLGNIESAIIERGINKD